MRDQEKLPDEEALYAQALAELTAGNTRPGLWAKAFAESAGDESKSKALYMKLRVQLEKESRQQEREAANAQAIETAQRKVAAFFAVIEQLRLNGYEAKKSGDGWAVREPLGGRVKLSSDEALLAYAESRVSVKPSKSVAPKKFGNTVSVPTTSAVSAPITPEAVQVGQGQVASPQGLVYASFWRRAAAQLVDYALLAAVYLCAAAAPKSIGPVLASFAIFLWIVYPPAAHASKWQATLGKRLLGIKVVNIRGERIGFWRALLRHLGSGIFIGCLLAMSTARRQALHDFATRTLVIRTGVPLGRSHAYLPTMVPVWGYAVCLFPIAIMLVGIAAGIAIPKYGTQIKSAVSSTQPVIATTREQFFARLDRQAPCWRILNKDEEFLQWLDKEHQGKSRQARLGEAYDKYDVASTAQFFLAYEDDNWFERSLLMSRRGEAADAKCTWLPRQEAK